VRRRWTVALAIAGGLGLAGCTFVPTDSSPQVVPSKVVPFHLLSRHAPLRLQQISATLWFSDNPPAASTEIGTLASAPRSLSRPVTDDALLAALLEGPTSVQSARGLSCDVGAGANPISVSESPGLVSVNLSGGLPSATSQTAERILALGQIVLTMARGRDVQVEIRVNGRAVPLLGPSGLSLGYSATAEDYKTLEVS
jgi:spore germination protein GerM